MGRNKKLAGLVDVCPVCLLSWDRCDQQQEKFSAQATLMPPLCRGNSYLGAKQQQGEQSRTGSLPIVIKSTKPRQGKSCVSYCAGSCYSTAFKSIVSLNAWSTLYFQVSPATLRPGKNIQQLLLCQS